MARRYEVTFDVVFDEDVDPAEAAREIDSMLGGVDHTSVFVRSEDEIDGSVTGQWSSVDDETDD